MMESELLEYIKLSKLIAEPAGVTFLVGIILKCSHSFILRKRPYKIIKKYYPDGTVQEIIEEYRR